MKPIDIHLKEDTDVDRVVEPIQLGIPIPRGELFDGSCVHLWNPATDEVLASQTKTLSQWPDGSIRWLKLNFLGTVEASSTVNLKLAKVTRSDANISVPLPCERKADGLHINTGKTQFRVPQGELKWFASSLAQTELSHEICLTNSNNTLSSLKSPIEWTITDQGPVSVSLCTHGEWHVGPGTTVARFNCRLRFYSGSKTAEVEICIHNPNRARHQGGLWDLGDPGSLYFRELAVLIQVPYSTETWLNPEAGEEVLRGDAINGIKLYQDSSGGDHWQSTNHIDAKGAISTRFRGYRVTSENKLLTTGDRARPIIALDGPGGTVQASMRQFWQNFPSALGAREHQLVIGLFPAEAEGSYELQGGERKTQTCYLSYAASQGSLLWTQSPLIPTLNAEHYERAEAFPWFRANTPKGPLDELIYEGLNGPRNFFAKREIIDEYGWRNFGDLFADHETLYQAPGEAPFISHYNNQYDPIYGFARQFALTGNHRWFELMDDLARHVTDIDIYHTDKDRVEYNNGLFWHTDHYLSAHTATHRTFSRHNDTSSTPGQTGGGPGAEHCYTTGLLYHYWMTGNEDSADAVIELAHWVHDSLEKPGGLLGHMLALKKQELPRLYSLAKSTTVLMHQYPFTRATGNYLNTLLDAWLISGDKQWRDQAERVIRKSLHPNDDPAQRNLLDVEASWSYLVLLSSITRYLLVKSQNCEQDENTSFAHYALIRYTRWMCKHERLYLEQSNLLEFPNHTWTAQDIRKPMLLYIASYLDLEHTESYRQKANLWLEQTLSTLQDTPEASYTRLLVILMQNYGPHQLDINPGLASGSVSLPLAVRKASPNLTWATLLKRILYRFITGLLAFRPSKEKAWLQTRLDR